MMDTLADIPLFADLSEDDAKRLGQRCRWNSYDAHAQVVDYDDESFDVWFLISGSARVLMRTENGRELVLCDMKPGDLFGEMSALDGQPRSANITTFETSKLCRMRRDDFEQAATHHPEVAKKLYAMFTSRIRSMNGQVREHAFMTNRQRLCAELMRRAKPRAINPQQFIVSPPPLQKDLADHLGCMREAVTREMSWLRKKGLVESSPGGCIIPDPHRLNALISESV